jgi:CubicO group peptidase (beta-lactamase class C family)
MSLNDYCHKNIFEPLGLKNITMFPTEDMKKRLAHMHQRNQNGTLVERDHLMLKVLGAKSDEIGDILNSGGAGAFATPSDYARKLQTYPSYYSRLTAIRNHRNPSQRRQIAQNWRPAAQKRDSRPHVHEPDLTIPRLRTPGNSCRQTRSHKPYLRRISSRR